MGGLIVRRLENTSDRRADSIADREFLTADIKRVEASEPSVRCSRRSSSYSANFSPDLSLLKPLRSLETPDDWMARIRQGLLERLKNGMRRCLPTKPWLMSRYISSWASGCQGRGPPPASHGVQTRGRPRKSHSLVGGLVTTKSNSGVVDDSLILVALNDT